MHIVLKHLLFRNQVLDKHLFCWKFLVLKFIFFLSFFLSADDISRVKLSEQSSPTDDYINANYMPVSCFISWYEI